MCLKRSSYGKDQALAVDGCLVNTLLQSLQKKKKKANASLSTISEAQNPEEGKRYFLFLMFGATSGEMFSF